MNSRLAVSILFVLFAVAGFRTEANDTFKKLKTLQHSWADKVPGGCTAAEILNRFTSRVSAPKSEFHGSKDMGTLIRAHGDCSVLARHCAPENQPCRSGSLSPDGKTNTSSFPDDANVASSQERHRQRRVMNLIDSGRHSAAVERVTTAVRQMHEVLDLMLTK
jgi:hypothetical protein